MKNAQKFTNWEVLRAFEIAVQWRRQYENNRKVINDFEFCWCFNL